MHIFSLKITRLVIIIQKANIVPKDNPSHNFEVVCSYAVGAQSRSVSSQLVGATGFVETTTCTSKQSCSCQSI